MRPLLAGLALAVLLGTAARAAELKALLDQLAPPPATQQGRVDVTGWLETSPQGTDLVVTLTPRGVARLAADPGIVVTPLARPDGEAPGEPVELVDPNLGYLTEPPVLRVPLPRHDGGEVEAQVDYAYCLVSSQCLFGEAVVRVE
ncbi:MAG TPA: hypothetical protein PKA13_15515 [Geminicoccaceae bacterium]|nr:hypothetical protein [Geminicoccus sp.]HMU51182.1 hypothetical protein [Geminicoccaceae bacterium]